MSQCYETCTTEYLTMLAPHQLAQGWVILSPGDIKRADDEYYDSRLSQWCPTTAHARIMPHHAICRRRLPLHYCECDWLDELSAGLALAGWEVVHAERATAYGRLAPGARTE